MKSEFQQWRDEIERPKLTVAERVAKWFEPRVVEAEPERDVYVWHDVGALIGARDA